MTANTTVVSKAVYGPWPGTVVDTTVYMTVYTTVYMAAVRAVYMGRIHGRVVTRRVQMYTAISVRPFTGRDHGRLRAMYAAVYTAEYTCKGLYSSMCTACASCVKVVYTDRIQGRVGAEHTCTPPLPHGR